LVTLQKLQRKLANHAAKKAETADFDQHWTALPAARSILQ
jgi:hypothetical protein